MKEFGRVEAPLRDGATEMVNKDGDRMHVDQIRVVCKGCGRVHRSVVFPWTPVIAKFECRACDYVTEVKTRDEAMDTIEAHIEEGAHQQYLRTRKSVNLHMPTSDETKAFGK